MSSKGTSIEFSIIICTYNREKLLLLALNSILKQTLAPDQLEIIIIDNNSADSTPLICEKFIQEHPELKTQYFVETNQGLSYARNRGINESRGEIVTFMDDDALLDEKFCEAKVNFFRDHPSINAAGGKILLHFLAPKPYWFNPFLASLLGYFNHGNRQKQFKRTYFRGSNMSFRKKIFESQAPFNTNLGRVGKNLAGSEEKEIFYRLKDAGEEIWYTPEAKVYHLVPEERTGTDFIKRQAVGAGESQKRMVKIKGGLSYLKSIISELLKWGVSLIIALFYFLTFRPGIAIVLLKFRYWISSGLF